MPFDPHLLRPEEPPLDDAGELKLPDDLAELAAQLRDDAAHLAAAYPSRSLLPEGTFFEGRRSKEGPARQAGPTWRRLTRAIASVAVIAALAVSAANWSERSWQRRPVVEPQLTHAPPATAEAAPMAPMPKPALPSPAPPAPASPALFLHDYSGPELEGLYDLLEDDEAAEPGTISI